MPLNALYPGQAAGETFNFRGKTDILIRHEDKNLLIAECKIWRGKESFLATIDQILSYLSYHDTKAAILVFSRNAHFATVLKEIESTAPTHTLYKSGPRIEGETEFHYVFGQKRDSDRKVFLAVLAFDVHSPS